MRSLKIVKYPWHTGHDYELTKLPHQIYVLGSTHRRWATEQRPVPTNVRFIPDIKFADADLMILHVDQWTSTEIDKYQLFTRWRDNFKGRKVVINHGSNLVDGCSSERMQQMIGDLPMICNSPTARERWAVQNSNFVRHGMSTQDWWQSNYGRNNIVVTQPASGLHEECRNGAAVIEFETRYETKVDWIGRDFKFDRFEKYRAFLASSSIFFNPSYASAFPRARTEAMLSGLVVVTTAAHGEADYIEHGVTGFYSNDMEELYSYLEYLQRRPDTVRRVGMAARSSAQRLFSSDIFVKQWQEVIACVMDGGRIDELKLDALRRSHCECESPKVLEGSLQ